MENVLLESSLRAAVMFGAMAAVLAMFHVRGAAVQHAAWSAVLVTMLLLPAWTAWGPDLPLRVLPAAPQEAEYFLAVEPLVFAPVSSARAIAQPATNAVPAGSWSSGSLSWGAVALGLYAFGALGMLARLLIGTVRAREIARRAILSDGILTSPQCSAPITVGWLKPAIVLPTHWTSWTAEQRDAVLVHEQEHVRRHDSLVQWLALLNCCIFWFHPLAWWLERKLNVLAEEACDAAVLGRGHSPQDYSTYLIDVARTVQRSGSRVTMSFAYRDRTLAHRVQRILSGAPATSLSRGRAALVATGSAVILAASTACTLDRSERRAEGEPTMNELLHRRAEKGRESQAREQAMRAEVNAMTPQQAQELEDRLKANPEDRDSYLKMVRYYQRIVDVQKLMALYQWFYEHAPEGTVYAGSINPKWDPAGYEKGKRIWLAHLKKANPSAEIYRRAARYLIAGDKPLAEQTLLDGQKMYPSEDWASPLGDVYAMAIVGSVGGFNVGNNPFGFSAEEANSDFAKTVRAKLEATNDPALLVHTAQRSMPWFRGQSPVIRPWSPSDLDLPRHYVDRALTIQPDHVPALSAKVQMEDLAASIQFRAAPDQLTVTERMRALRTKLQGRVKAAEPFARELVTLAADNPSDSEYGSAIFFANQLLGEAALQRNDKKEAVRLFRASMEAPVTDRMRYGVIDVTLARNLVDWGERTAVAEFLEHCATFNKVSPEAYDFKGWAAQIRAGKNPELIPYHSYPPE